MRRWHDEVTVHNDYYVAGGDVWAVDRRPVSRARWACVDVDRCGAMDLAGFAIVHSAHTWP